ncbi:MAG: GNAT family N-acetyltransferase [Rhodomicrobiaceae bacterium]
MARIVPLAEADDPAVRTAIDAIFFDSAATKTFASQDERAAYRELWLGRYLRHCPADCFVALDAGGSVMGYLAGSLFSDRAPLAGPDYYTLCPPALVDIYPAHVHVNVRADCRGREAGSELVAAFRAHCGANGIGGLHAVTTAGSKAASFFEHCGLAERATASWRDRQIVFLGESLD